MVRRRWCCLAVLLVLTGCAQQGPRATPPVTPAAAAAPPEEVVASPAAVVASVDIAARTLARIPLPGGPDYLARSGGLVWVKHDDGKLLGLDPTSGDVRRTVRVARTPGAPGGACQGLGGDAEHLWTCSGAGVALVDPQAAHVDPVPGVEKVADQTNLPVQRGRVWVLDPNGTTVHGLPVDGRGDPVRLTVDVRCGDAAAGEPPYLWLACPGAGVGARLDTDSGELVEVPALRGARTVAVVGRHVFFGYRSGIARVDRQTAQVTGAVAVAGGTGLHATPDALWVRGGSAFLRKVDPDSLSILEEITGPRISDGSVLVADGTVWATAYDDAVLYRLRPSG